MAHFNTYDGMFMLIYILCNSVSIFFDGCNWYDSIAMSNLKPAPPGGEYVLNLGSLVATLW